MLDALSEFIYVIKEFLLGIVKGLWQLVNALLFVFDLMTNLFTQFAYFPTAIISVALVCMILLVLLRVVGR